MLENINPSDILFLDIETVPQYPSFYELPIRKAGLWEKKFSILRKGSDEDHITGYHRAGIYAEFGKIICISCGCFQGDELIMFSFHGHDEQLLLNNFIEFLNNFSRKGNKLLCAHNGKEFDFPYLCRRILLNSLRLPALLNIAGKKPWEIAHLDTMELWKFGDYKAYTTLELLCSIFEIPTPKDDIDGSMVWRIYWEENDLERISTYCMKDVISIAKLVRKFRGEEIDNIDVSYQSLTNA